MNAPPSFGAALVGFAIACFLCGSMLVQVYFYIRSESANGDSVRFKGLVGLICAVDLTQLFFLGWYIYECLILHYGDPSYLGQGPWTFAMVTGLSVYVSTPVQLFYAWRVYILGQRCRILPVVISIFSLLSFSCGTATGVLAYKIGVFDKFSSISFLVDSWLAADIVTDVLIVSSLCYFLTRGRTGFSRTNMLIDKMVFLVVNTGLAPTLMEAAHLISFSVIPNSFAHLAFNFVVPKLYANSFMATLNARAYLLHSSKRVAIQSHAPSFIQESEHERYELPIFAPPQNRPREECNDSVIDIKITAIPDRYSRDSVSVSVHQKDYDNRLSTLSTLRSAS